MIGYNCKRGEKMRVTITLAGHIVQIEDLKFVHVKPAYICHQRICADVCGYLIRYPLTPVQKEAGEKIISRL